jgi:peptidoglycan hydrolase-like protein with peptidoglycan-binding domain
LGGLLAPHSWEAARWRDALAHDAHGPFVLGASVLAALSILSVGVLLYGGRNLEAVQVPAGVDRPPADPFARYRSQMTLVQETLGRFGYEPGPIDGVMRFKTASALRAFQQKHGLSVTGRTNPETLATLGIEDRVLRRRH